MFRSLDPIAFGNSLLQWLIAFMIFAVSFSLALLLRRFLIQRMLKKASAERNANGDLHSFLASLFTRTKVVFLFVATLIASSENLNLNLRAEKILHSVFVVCLWAQVALWADETLRFFLTRLLKQREFKRGPDPALITSVSILQFLGRLAIYGLIGILILDNLGFNVTTLVAGLGVGGIAVALAAKNILGDLFASLSIVLDKPFVIGDLIEVGPLKGRIEKVGLKTTRIRSISGEQIVMSNTDLLHSRILNFARMDEKRNLLTLSIRYETPSEKLRRIPQIIRSVIERHENARVENILFKNFGDSGLLFEVSYFVISRNPSDYGACEEKINFGVFEAFEKEAVAFAYPTRVVRMEKMNER